VVNISINTPVPATRKV